MDKEYPAEAWRRLGKALEARRGQLGYGFRQRENFLADRGGPPPSLKTLARLERGERATYPDATVTRLESLYEVAPGSFEAFLEAVLAGGDAELPPAASGPAGLRSVPDAAPAAAGTPAERKRDELLAEYPDDEVLRMISRGHGVKTSQVVMEMLDWLGSQGPWAPPQENNGTAGLTFPEECVKV